VKIGNDVRSRSGSTGKLLWQTRVGEGGEQGGVIYGGTSDDPARSLDGHSAGYARFPVMASNVLLAFSTNGK
jgi:hypothetical protein